MDQIANGADPDELKQTLPGFINKWKLGEPPSIDVEQVNYTNLKERLNKGEQKLICKIYYILKAYDNAIIASAEFPVKASDQNVPVGQKQLC